MEKNLDELQLVKASIDGDQLSFKKIVDCYQGQVASVIHGMLGPCEESRDVAQRVFIRFYQSMKSFRGDSKLGTFLSRIAINLCLNEIQKRKKELARMESIDVETVGAKPKDENKIHSLKLIELALQKLDSTYRSVIVLRLMNGYSTQETASILEIPLGTVLSRLARGQKKLRVLVREVEASL